MDYSIGVRVGIRVGRGRRVAVRLYSILRICNAIYILDTVQCQYNTRR